MSAATSSDAVRSPEPTRVLLAVRGGEPDGWAREIPRILAMWSRPSIRILAVVAAPAPAFTSLLPAAGRMYGAARAAWRDAEEKKIQRVIDELTAGLPGVPDVVWARVAGDPGRAITEHARRWPADALLMAATSGLGARLCGVQDRVVRDVGCPVVLTPASPVAQEA